MGEEDPDYSFNDHAIGLLTYKGNSVSWWWSKAENYKAALGRAWASMAAAGRPADGHTELCDAIGAALAKPPPPNWKRLSSGCNQRWTTRRVNAEIQRLRIRPTSAS